MTDDEIDVAAREYVLGHNLRMREFARAIEARVRAEESERLEAERNSAFHLLQRRVKTVRAEERERCIHTIRGARINNLVITLDRAVEAIRELK